MDAIIKKQSALGEFLRRSVINLKKKGDVSDAAIQARLSLHERYWTQYSGQHLDLVSLPDVDKTDYMQKDYYGEIEQLYCDLKNEMLEMLSPVQTPPVTPVNNKPTTGANYEAHSSRHAAKLPQLELPKFNGVKLTWESYRDLFTSLVADNPDRSNVSKLQYLKLTLSGEPAAIIRNIPVIDANWDEAWNLLKDRYDDKRVLLNTYLEHLVKSTPAQRESAAELKRILDIACESRRGLQNLKRPVHRQDDWFVYLTVSNMDHTTRKAWELDAQGSDFPTFENLEEFMKNRIRALEAIPVVEPESPSVNKEKTTQRSQPSKPAKPNHATQRVGANVAQAPSNTEKVRVRVCFLCKADHVLMHCADFKNKSVPERIKFVDNLQLCQNCFGKHALADCTSKGVCWSCQKTHHSLLHKDVTVSANVCQTELAKPTKNWPAVMLATVRVCLTANGRSITVRALLDSCAEASFVSEYVVQHLALKRCLASVSVDGIGGSRPVQPKHFVQLQVNSCNSEMYSLTTNALVLKSVLANREPACFPMATWSHLEGIELADPDYASGRRLEVILGVGVYAEIIRAGIKRGSPGTPLAQETALGWVILGQVHEVPAKSSSLNLPCMVSSSISDQLRTFWETEELSHEVPLSEEDRTCEELFTTTTVRDKTGRYVVRLPLRREVLLGDSKIRARRCLESGERRRLKDYELNNAYVNFMSEYKSLGHMTQSESGTCENFLPHHAVWKGDKIRVVFNAAAVTASGFSLNDALMTGPRLQRNVEEVLLNWRRYAVVFTADIVKMFRGILVHHDDQRLQGILWRSDPSELIKEWRLLTVTYGTACAPWLALRTLHRLAADESHRFPSGAQILQTETYVDDCFSGDSNVPKAQERMDQLVNILRAGGFELAKWASNAPELISDVQSSTPELELKTDGVVKTLGLFWDSRHDTFGYRVNLVEGTSVTRRDVLSKIARLFDPSGWIAPVIVLAKIFMQKLWLLHEDWDALLPSHLADEWKNYYEQLPEVAVIAIPRWIGLGTHMSCELHGFSDSSEKAFAATVYVRVTNSDNSVSVSLLVAKTKVAPVKTVSVPRLELCGAVLLTRLLNKVLLSLNWTATSVPIHAWCDSTVVLAWLKSHPSRWCCYVANRVTEIHTSLPVATWHHVPTKDNPADIATRGLMPNELRECQQWWNGPVWLHKDRNYWPCQHEPLSTELELRPVKVATVLVSEPWELIKAYSSVTKLFKVTALCHRFVTNIRTPKIHRVTGPVTVLELDWSQKFWVRQTQSEHFTNLSSPRLKGLCPFRDQEGVIRLGGRLQNSSLSYDEQHPIVLPGNCVLATLLIAQAHIKTLHGGIQLTLSHLHRTYWLLRGKTCVKRYVRKCTKCFRFRARAQSQIMGQLPASRCTANRPFLHTGVDYAGPIDLRLSRGRGVRSYKGYFALFVCMCTKAVHIEVVSDLTTAAFLAAFRRMVSRRGLVQTLYSDNATNFKGAATELRGMFDKVQTAELVTLLANDKVNWVFIPPRAPHFGGLWEAGVKSLKHHIRRVVGDSTLSYEELSTVCAQIEACLNSRPITPMSSHPDDYNALTPGHFLVGHALTTVPEPSVLDTNPNRLTRWKLLQHMVEDFWTRWHKDYLSQLQQRSKWSTVKPSLLVNDLVLILEDGLPPSKWRLGRIVAVHPGRDGHTRVVDVKVADGVKTRSISKLARLPVEVSSD